MNETGPKQVVSSGGDCYHYVYYDTIHSILVADERIRPDAWSLAITRGYRRSPPMTLSRNPQTNDEVDLTQQLQGHAVLHDIDPPYCSMIAAFTRKLYIPAERWLFRRNETAEELFLLTEGRLALRLSGKTVLTVGRDELVDASCLAPPYRRGCDAVALEAVIALAIDTERLRQEWERDHRFGFACAKRLAATVAEELINCRLQAADLYQ